MTTVVQLDKLKEVLGYLNTINSTPIEDIVWLKGGMKVVPPDGAIEEWKFIGLNNSDFAKAYGLIDAT